MLGDILDVFTKLKKAFTSALILRYFDPKRPVRVETDALETAISGILY
jgi:hypothetical protein